ncbi:hypothetical protein D5H75_36805 [Bailinhaonella thermotolerans]|uniref:Serine protease n=2 Tax=Bailinhaonella thermotolerans TaxID=1070861 RepID=A0A3A4A8X5_9ACTN|nr:hypothetical protein D5H75_36805 [Bailinhaonella thermotolerans]
MLGGLLPAATPWQAPRAGSPAGALTESLSAPASASSSGAGSAPSSASSPASPPAEVVEHAARQRPGYWTPERMARATPLGLLADTVDALLAPSAVPRKARQTHRPSARSAGARWPSAGKVARTTGRVFLTIDKTDFVCSATTVPSASRDLVVTAGHCLMDPLLGWAENWTFVPGYDAGGKPYGVYTARRMFVPSAWSKRGDDSYDVGMAALNTAGGRHVADAVGVQRIAFTSQRGRQVYAFGYPADPPYDGGELVYCSGKPKPDPHKQTMDHGLRCDMTAGSSGGPWLTGFDPRTGEGTVTSVSSFKYGDDMKTMYGPHFGPPIRALYTKASRA